MLFRSKGMGTEWDKEVVGKVDPQKSVLCLAQVFLRCRNAFANGVLVSLQNTNPFVLTLKIFQIFYFYLLIVCVRISRSVMSDFL